MPSHGRLDIYRPESTVINIPIDQEVTAIGRQGGNDVVIDRNGVSRYHAVIRIQNQQVMLEDLDTVNGTYVDSFRLPPNEPRPLRGGEEIQIGDVRLIYYPAETLEDTAPGGIEDRTQQLETEHVAAYIVKPDMVVVPGSNAELTLLIENRTDETDRFELSVEGIPTEWLRLERQEVELDPDEQIHLIANFKPTRRSDTLPGEYPMTLWITPKATPEQSVSTEVILKVGAYSGFGIVQSTPEVAGANPFQVHIHNHGNAPLTVNFRGVDPTGTLDYDLNPNHATLGPGERQIIEGTIKPRSGALFGTPRTYTYDIIALSRDASGFQAAVSGSYTSRPLLPGWVPAAAVPVVALALIALVGGLLALLGSGDGEDDPDPRINSFTIANEQTEITLGDPVLLEWDVENTASVVVSFARPDQPPQTIDVDDLDAGAYQLELEASGVYTVTFDAGRDARESLVVSVLPRIITLEADPSVLLQNIEQDVQLSWEYEGATQLDGRPDVVLESETLATIQGEGLPQRGSNTYRVRPQDDVAITLRVRGNDGTESSRTLQLTYEAPRCVLSNTTAIAYTGPGRTYPQVTTYTDAETTISPTRRNDQADWLQFTWDEQPAWVRVADFDCENFRVNQLDAIEELPPPPPSPTPTQRPVTPTEAPDVTEVP